MFGRLGALGKIGSLGAGGGSASADDTAVTISQISAVEAKTNATAVVGISQVAGIQIETEPAAEFNAVAAVTAAGKAGYVGAPAVSNIAAVTAAGAAGYAASVAVSSIAATSIERTVGYSWTNTEGETFEAAMSGTYSDAKLGVLDTLITDLKTGLTHSTNTYAALDFLALHFLDNATDALRWFNSPSTLMTAVNTPTHTADQGYTGNQSSSYINANFAPSADGVQYAQNDASIGVWVHTENTGNSNYYIGACDASFSNISGVFKGVSDILSHGPNGGGIVSTSATGTGLWVANRTTSSAQQTYKNGSSAGTGAGTSTASTASDLFLLAFNNNGSASNYGDGQISASFAGRALTANEQVDIHAALDKAITAWAAA